MMDAMTLTRERVAKRDVAIAAVLSLLGLALMLTNVIGDDRLADGRLTDPDARAAIHIGNLLPFELAVPLFLLVTVPLVWRRAAPLAALGLALGGLALHEALFGSELVRCGVLLPTTFVFAFTVGALLESRPARIGLALALGLILITVPFELGPPVAAVMGAVTAAMWGIGRIVRSRGRMAKELETRTTELRQARDERARMEVAADRARLSRELDELLQRRLGELARLAQEDAGRADAAVASATLAQIERESRRTLEEMRAVVGVLRENDGVKAPKGPQPALTQLEALLVSAKGRDARLTIEGNPRVLPPAVELSAYRIVEHLLAALDDASDVGVRVRFGDDALEIRVSGPARRRAKAAIEQARERARLQSGTLEATVRGGRAKAVVSLPMVA
jgi:signal transduction histidine kinase